MLGAVIRFVVSALVLLLLGFILPGFRIMGFVNALLAALAIAVIGYIVEALMGQRVSPQNRGIIGFLTAAVVIWLTQFIVPSMEVSIIGALLASRVVGIIDAVVPTGLRWRGRSQPRHSARPPVMHLSIWEGNSGHILEQLPPGGPWGPAGAPSPGTGPGLSCSCGL